MSREDIVVTWGICLLCGGLLLGIVFACQVCIWLSGG